MRLRYPRGVRSTDCPRCGTAMRPVRLGLRDGGAYREAAGTGASERGWQCPSCGAGIVPGPLVDWLMKRVPVGGGPSERHRETTRIACPGCFASLDAIALTWGTSFVEIEQCAGCHTMMLDAGELPKVFAIEHAAHEE